VHLAEVNIGRMKTALIRVLLSAALGLVAAEGAARAFWWFDFGVPFTRRPE
jgi:hypothetical protein